jgi:hypothetical protein
MYVLFLLCYPSSIYEEKRKEKNEENPTKKETKEKRKGKQFY